MYSHHTACGRLVVVDTVDGGFRTISRRIEHARLRLSPSIKAEAQGWSQQFQDKELLTVSGEINAASNKLLEAIRGWSEPIAEQVQKLLMDKAIPVSIKATPGQALACKAAAFHDDVSYHDKIFVVVWLGGEGFKLVFPNVGSVDLTFGTMVVFDPALPHGVISKHADKFYPPAYDETFPQFFLSWDVDSSQEIGQWLGVAELDDYPDDALVVDPIEESKVCPCSGQYLYL